MSHLSELKTQVKDAECIVEMFRGIFGEKAQIEQSDCANILVENRYDEDQESQYANIVLKTKSLGATADIGFAFDAESKTYRMIWDGWSLRNHLFNCFKADYESYAKNHSRNFDEFVEHHIAEQYGLQVALKSARQAGAEVTSIERQENGTLKVSVKGAVRERTRQATTQLTRRSR